MRPLKSSVNYHDYYIDFFDNFDDVFADFELAEYSENGNWPDNRTLPLRVTRPAGPIEQLSESHFRHIYKCWYRYIKAYIK